MEMKRNYLGIFVVTAALVMSGCDYVDAPYTVPGPNGCTVAEPSFTPRTNPVRKVLVEDITGHRCGNCPLASTEIDQLKTTYGDQVVAVGLHSSLSGTFTEILTDDTLLNPSLKYIYDFRTEPANTIDGKFGVSTIGLPNGMVNRKDFGGGVVVGHTTWASHVSTLLALPPDMDIQLKNFWDPVDSSLCSYVYVEALTNLTGTYKVCVFATEDSIVQWQKDYSMAPTDVEFYEHKHVLRAAMSTVWGTTLTSETSISDGDTFVNGYSITVDPSKWDVNNMHVIAFVYNADTDEVIQAEELKVVP